MLYMYIHTYYTFSCCRKCTQQNIIYNKVFFIPPAAPPLSTPARKKGVCGRCVCWRVRLLYIITWLFEGLSTTKCCIYTSTIYNNFHFSFFDGKSASVLNFKTDFACILMHWENTARIKSVKYEILFLRYFDVIEKKYTHTKKTCIESYNNKCRVENITFLQQQRQRHGERARLLWKFVGLFSITASKIHYARTCGVPTTSDFCCCCVQRTQ